MQRKTYPIALAAALTLAEMFYPDIKLSDFTGRAGPWKLQPIDARTAERMRYRA